MVSGNAYGQRASAKNKRGKLRGTDDFKARSTLYSGCALMWAKIVLRVQRISFQSVASAAALAREKCAWIGFVYAVTCSRASHV